VSLINVTVHDISNPLPSGPSEADDKIIETFPVAVLEASPSSAASAQQATETKTSIEPMVGRNIR
jgi:hypothetical protein